MGLTPPAMSTQDGRRSVQAQKATSRKWRDLNLLTSCLSHRKLRTKCTGKMKLTVPMDSTCRTRERIV